MSVDEFWCPDGPSLDFSLHPRLIQNAHLANSILKIDGFCAGHYLKPDKLVSSITTPSKATPPSQVLSKVFKENNGFPDEDVIAATASNVSLKPEEVRMWFKHLEIVQNNRKKGVKKAAATRKAKNKGGTVAETTDKQPLRDSDGDELCNTRGKFNPELQDNYDDDFAWIACTKCELVYNIFPYIGYVTLAKVHRQIQLLLIFIFHFVYCWEQGGM